MSDAVSKGPDLIDHVDRRAIIRVRSGSVTHMPALLPDERLRPDYPLRTSSPSIRPRRGANLQIESVRRRRVVTLVRRRVDVAAAAGVDARGQPALLEFGLDLIGIERR